ncbi:MAG: hypothetical protein K0U98_14955 [Deltaproteobacteria bacterium]|nr:hypothetical protein [Deltaproteobacteria bacterium]
MLQLGVRYQLQKLVEAVERFGCHGWDEWKVEKWSERLTSRLLRAHEGRQYASL